MAPPQDFLLYRHAETAWQRVVRPWLAEAKRLDRRSWVLVPTRGQAQSWKQRCVDAGVSLLGVEFLTPGLARQKWLEPEPGQPLRRALGREFLLWGLRECIEQHQRERVLDEGDRALLLSLQSDLETALDDFDTLLRSGRSADDFPWPVLRAVFRALEAWVESRGYAFSPRQAMAAALQVGRSPSPARLLVLGLGPENGNEFYSVLALLRRASEVTLLLPEPEFRGRQTLDERWLERWEQALGAVATPLEDEPPARHAGGAVEGWLPDADEEEPLDWARVGFSVAPDRRTEAAAAVARITRWLDAGAGSIAVILPRADDLYLGLKSALRRAGLSFQDQIGGSGLPEPELALQRSLVRFWAKGSRWPELLALWPRLWTLGLTTVPAVDMRRAGQRWFERTQSPAVHSALPLLEGSTRPEAVELVRLAPRLCIQFPDTLTLAEFVTRSEAAFLAWETGSPDCLADLRGFAERETAPRPVSSWLALLESFLAQPTASAEAVSGRFERVVLTTRRRAEGVPWTHVLLVEANAGRWPERRESSCWLPDDARRLLSAQTERLPLPTADERAWLERCGYARLARDTAEQLHLSAALLDPAEPEGAMSPNSWLERLLWRREADCGGAIRQGLDSLFARAAGVRGAAPSPAAAPAQGEAAVAEWASVWRGRRDPTRGFDAYFLSVPTQRELGPAAAAARVVEAGLADPAVIWYEEVLKATPVSWEPWLRARAKWIGQRVHELLAAALPGPVAEGDFRRLASEEEARARLAAEAERLQKSYPNDQYWESCFAELKGQGLRLLRELYRSPLREFCAAEYKLPAGAWVPLPEGERLGLRGRLDLVLSDRSEWRGAQVTVVDFKTGRDGTLSLERLGKGASLQLGLYLAAVRSLGVDAGEVRMVRPQPGADEVVPMTELDRLLPALALLQRQRRTGCYGALTPESKKYSDVGYTWPLACVPVPTNVLKAKQAVTHPEVSP